MMKALILAASLSLSLVASADVYLQPGESINLYGNNVSCGMQYQSASYYCTIESSFDGVFSGEGRTELEARTNAKRSCQAGSRNRGFFCNDNTLNCQRSN